MTVCGPVGEGLAELDVVEDVPVIEIELVELDCVTEVELDCVVEVVELDCVVEVLELDCVIEVDTDAELEVVPPVTSEIEVVDCVVELELELTGTTAEVLSL